MGWNPFDPTGLQKKTKKELGRAAKKAGLDDMLAFEKNNLKYWYDALREDPERLLMPVFGADPIQSKVFGEILNKDYEPMLNQMGGPSKGAYVDAMEKDIDTSSSAGAHAIAAAVASWYAGGAGSAASAGTVMPITQSAAAGLTTAGAAAADEEFDPLENIDLGGLQAASQPRGTFRVGNVPGFTKGGKVMPSKSPAQARLMRAAAHGWKKPGGGGPSRAVAQEFVNADRMWTGGLAAMNEVNSGIDKTLNFFHGGEVDPQWLSDATSYYNLGDEPLTFNQLVKKFGGGYKGYFKALALGESGGWTSGVGEGEEVLKDTLFYPPQQTLTGAGETEPPYIPPSGAGGGPNQGPRGGGGRGNRGGGRTGPWPKPDDSCESGWIGRAGNCRPVGTTGPGGGGGGGGGGNGGGGGGNGGGGGGGGGNGGGGNGDGPPVPPYVPPERREGRDTEYSEALRAHKARVAASLAVPPGGYAGGGQVNYYQEGGEVRPGHPEGANPYPEGSARYRYWETRNHVAPEPPPPVVDAQPEPEDLSWLDRLRQTLGGGGDRTAEELEEMGEAYGGYIQDFQGGGLARAMGPMRGGRMGMRNPRQRIPSPRGGGMPGRGRRGMPPMRGGPNRGPRGPVIPPGGGGQGPYGPSMPQFPPGKGLHRTPPPGKDPRNFPSTPPPGGGMMFPGGSSTFDESAGMPPPIPAGGGMPPPGDMQTQGERIPGMQLPPLNRTPSGEIDLGGGRTPEWGPQGPVAGGGGSGLMGRLRQQVGPQRGGIPPISGGGMLSRMRQQAEAQRGATPGGAPRIMGGPQVAPNMRGMLQKQRMMNRPPANVGGGANRVGMQDQQGALARAQQRGTGRRPMSRRGGFPGRN